MKFWTDKQGKELNSKEFFEKWKQGIQNVSPIQQVLFTLIGGTIVLIGIIWGIIFSFLLKQWWLVIILIGSFLISFVGLYGNWQKYSNMKRIENIMKNQCKEVNAANGN